MPHLAELVKLHKDAPFSLIGINAHDSAEAFRKGAADFGVDWQVAFDGTEAPICRQFRVAAFPTILVLDAEGRIVATGLRGERLAAKVAELLATMEA